MTEQEPSRGLDPADDGSLAGLIRHAVNKALQQTDGMMMARVISHDRQRGVVKVQPLVKVTGTEGEQIERAPIAEIPVARMGGGGVAISSPLKVGDVGYLFAGDRDNSLVAQGNYAKPEPANTDAVKSFSGGVFFPTQNPAYPTAADEEGSMTIGSTSGNVRIVTNEDGTLRLYGVGIYATGPLSVVGDVTITGNLKVSGSVEGMGGIKLETHRHNGVTAGGGNSGGPIV